MASRQGDDSFSMGKQERAGTDEQRTSAASGKCSKGSINVTAAVGIENDEVLSNRVRRGLQVEFVLPRFALYSGR